MTEEIITEQENQEATQEQATGPSGNGAPLTFDEILEDRGYQGEFDRRVAKALETAKAKWEKGAQASQQKAVEEATSQINAELVNAMIQTELVRARARDVDVVLPLIDAAKVSRTEGGLEGLAEQIDALKASKGYLFEQDEAPKPTGRTGLQHDDNDADADDTKIRRIMGLPQK